MKLELKNIDVINKSLSELELSDLRKAIDEIDYTIIDLLNKRLEIVDLVGKLKESENNDKSFIRSAREAIMIRGLIKRSNYDSRLIINIWRNLISASLNHEKKLAIKADSQESYWKAREYFGNHSDIEIKNIEEINFKHEVGVLSKKSWWNNISEARIFAIIPFHKDSNPCFAVTNIENEESFDDSTLIVAKNKNILSELEQKNIDHEILDFDETYLVRANGFIKEVTNGKIIGSYANPIEENK